VQRLALQALFVLVVVAAYWWIAGNLVENLDRQNLDTSFEFLDQPAGFAIPDSDFDSSESVGRAIRVGVKNTATVAVTGIALATIVGILIGVARLAQNWIVRRAASVYVETLRNIPVLVVIIFVYFALVLRLPPLADAVQWAGALILSNSGVAVPSLKDAGGSAAFGRVVVAAVIAAIAVWNWRGRVFAQTGRAAHRGRWVLGTFAVIVAGGYAALGGPVELSLPERVGPRVLGGITLNPEYAALLVGLVLYTSSHIAEIVRGSILAVPSGQSEAALALGLSEPQKIRLVVLPQAFRIMIPPLANQYLNLTKNSSLAIAIGYAELTRITRIAIGQGSPAPQAIAVLMGLYLMLSLTISAIANIVNRRLQIGTR